MLSGRESHRELPQRKKDRVAHSEYAVCGVADELYVTCALQELFEENGDLTSREMGSETEVRAASTKCDVFVGRPVDVKTVWIFEVVGVSVARWVPQ